MSAILGVRGLGKSFGGIRAVDGLDLDVGQGEIVGLIGPNGSGKTTTVNVLTGVYAASSGQVTLAGQDITRAKPEAIVQAGLARTFQNLRVFAERTVLENVRLSQTMRVALPERFRLGAGGPERRLRAEVDELIGRLGLSARAHVMAGRLSYGEKKRLEIARALATRPAILLLDEPAAGMNPVEVDDLAGIIAGIRAHGIGVLLIEHHMKLVMRVCDRIVVLNFGQKIAEGPPAAVAADPAVIACYLGQAA